MVEPRSESALPQDRQREKSALVARILVVEDEGIVARDIEKSLLRLGYTVAAVTATGEEAVRLAGELRPDLVLMDIRLAGAMDGIEAAAQIRRDFHLPVVYLTAYADPSTLRQAKITEPFGYILKPFEDRELQTAIEMALYKHQAERRLRESQQWLDTTLRSIGDAVIATDTFGSVAFMNPMAESLTGWRQEEATGKAVSQVFQLIDGKTRIPISSPVNHVLTEGRGVGLPPDTVLISRDQSERPIDDGMNPIKDHTGKISGAVVVFQDITERKEAEEQLQKALEQQKILARHLHSVREDERARVARELHDELGQVLTGLKIDIVRLKRYVTQDSPNIATDPVLNKIDAINTLVNTTLQNVRKIATELRPAILDTLSLIPALEWQAQDFQSRTGIPCQFVATVEELSLDPERMTAIFRIFQETLTNVLRHAQATQVRVSLDIKEGHLVLVVQDNGIGIRENEVQGNKSLGLLGIRERALLIGGEVQIIGVPGQGTTVTVRLPLQTSG